ncbi:MAG: 4-hydroxythreonine-4-phosphate dehydrogenase [Campylobacterales bacterium]|nr:4-hydroxythreonine-4-phosphate dehydrogenase [Campylobacterales bacterium]
MPALKTLAVSVGDLNGVGFEILLKAHDEIKHMCRPLYCISRSMASQAAGLLDTVLPEDFECHEVAGEFVIRPGIVESSSGRYSYESFVAAVELAKNGLAEGITTLPIHKEAWMMAGIGYKGHTDALRDFFAQDAIMMLGCDKLYVALFTEHIPLRDVASRIQTEKLVSFLIRLHENTGTDSAAVLGLNPHAGDHGVLGDEEREIEKAIALANTRLGKEVFYGPIVPDVAFTPRFRAHCRMIVAMYHDQGLAPLKALYFDESINVSLGLPVIRTSVDHGTAFDIAYDHKASVTSYLNAVRAAIGFAAAKG